MTTLENSSAAPPGGRYRATLLKASLAGGVAGLALGLWQNGLPDSPFMLAGAAVAATVAAYYTREAMRMRKPSVAKAVARVRAAVAALPTWNRPLLLAAPGTRTGSKPKAARKAKPAAQKRAAENQAAPNAEPGAPVEDERARLKAEGHTDAEISQILIMRATGNATAKGGFGTGTAAGAFLNNLDAVLGYARHLVPSFKSDLERMFNESAEKAERVAGALSFGLKCAALGVLGYFLWIEAVEFRARAYKSWVEWCIAEQQNAINHATMNELLAGKKLDGDDECRTP